MGWRDVSLIDLSEKIHHLEPYAAPEWTMAVRYMPLTCAVLHRLGNEVLDALTWEWPTNDEEFLIREDLDRSFGEFHEMGRL